MTVTLLSVRGRHVSDHDAAHIIAKRIKDILGKGYDVRVRKRLINAQLFHVKRYDIVIIGNPHPGLLKAVPEMLSITHYYVDKKIKQTKHYKKFIQSL